MGASVSAGFVFLMMMLAAGPAVAQQTTAAPGTIRVLCTQALRTSLQEIAPRFERNSGHKIELVIAPSGKLAARVRDGEQADLVIANAPNVDDLIAERKVTGSRINLARADVGLVVRKGAAKPDVSTPDGVKRALLAASAVAWSPNGLSGAIFEAALAKLGITEQVRAKAKLGSPAAGFVARGEADLAAQQIPELIAVEGVELLGPLPAELEATTQFSVGQLATAAQPELARALIEFLTSPEAVEVVKAKGLSPG